MASSSSVRAVRGVVKGSSEESGGRFRSVSADGACALSCTVVCSSSVGPARGRTLANQKDRGSRCGFRGPGRCRPDPESGWITPGFEPAEGPLLVVLLRRPGSGTIGRQGIGKCPCRCRYRRCLHRSLTALAETRFIGAG